MTRKVPRLGVELIKRFEGLRLKAYKCPAGVWTIGYGHTEDVHEGQEITSHQAEVILEYDLEHFAEAVDVLCPGASDNQFAALVSFAFNVGTAALAGSTLRRHFNNGFPAQAATQFERWVHAGGRVEPGLVKRRAAERDLFLLPSPEVPSGA